VQQFPSAGFSPAVELLREVGPAITSGDRASVSEARFRGLEVRKV
jgi:hypothetical protein